MPRHLSAFMNVSLDGFFCDARGDMSFAHKAPDDTEWNDFVGENASGGGALLFGRTTYQMMSAWWPTPMAIQMLPDVARYMNALPKFVFSRALTSAEWSNTTLISEDAVSALRRMKGEPGPDMATLGSGTLVGHLANAGLLDSLQIVVNPVALGAGRSFLSQLTEPRKFRLTKSRVFGNGAVVLWYEPR